MYLLGCYITKNFILPSSSFFGWPSYLIAKTISVRLLNVLSRDLLNKTWWCALWITASRFVSCLFYILLPYPLLFITFILLHLLLPFTCISLSLSLFLSHVLSQVSNAHTYRQKSSVVDWTEHAHKAASPCTVTETEKKPEEDDVKVREDGYSWLANTISETPKKQDRRIVLLWWWWGGRGGWWGSWNMQKMKRLWWWNSSR